MELPKSFTTLAPRAGVFSCFIPSWPRRGPGTEWVFADYRKIGRRGKKEASSTKRAVETACEGHSGESGACEE